MKTIRCFFFLFAVLAASSASGQQAVTLGLRTVREQAALLNPNKPTSQPIAFPTANPSLASWHVQKANSLLNQLQTLKPDGTRAGNPLYRQVIFHLEQARAAGIGYETALDEISRRSGVVPVLKEMRKTRLRTDLKYANEGGLLTPENMARLKDGRAPVVTKGNPRYIGEPVEVDHRVPVSKRAVFENEPANFQLLPRSLNREKGPRKIFPEYEQQLDGAYWAQSAIAGGAKGAVGILILLHETPQAWAAIADLNSASPEQRLAVLLSVGEHSSFAVMGGGLATGGFAQVAAGFSKSASTVTRLASIGKWGRGLGWAGFVVAEGFAIAEFQTGAITERQFYSSQAALLAGTGGAILAGFLSGAGAGFVLGVATPPVVVITTIVGGFAGGYAASEAATLLVEGYYSSLDENQKRQVREFIYQHYGVTR